MGWVWGWERRGVNESFELAVEGWGVRQTVFGRNELHFREPDFPLLMLGNEFIGDFGSSRVVHRNVSVCRYRQVRTFRKKNPIKIDLVRERYARQALPLTLRIW